MHTTWAHSQKLWYWIPSHGFWPTDANHRTFIRIQATRCAFFIQLHGNGIPRFRFQKRLFRGRASGFSILRHGCIPEFGKVAERYIPLKHGHQCNANQCCEVKSRLSRISCGRDCMATIEYPKTIKSPSRRFLGQFFARSGLTLAHMPQ